MALDATKGNRAKDNFSLSVDYSTIYKTTNETEIRKLMAFECVMIDYIKTIDEKEIIDFKKKVDTFQKYTDRELSELRIKQSEVLKLMLKPEYELISKNITDDNKVVGVVMNNKTSKTEGFLLDIPEGETISSYLDILVNKLCEASNKAKTPTKTINKLRKEILILGQVEEIEKQNNI